jgi:hypothetical protein
MHPIFKISSRISPIFRRRRLQRFLESFKPTEETSMLDVGGLPRAWSDVRVPGSMQIVNLEPLDAYEESFLAGNQRFVVGDGTRLHYRNQTFDIVYSNSVIEHLGTWERQVAFAREARRVGRGYWIQTPAKECPIEPHYFGLFVHWFPKRVQRRLLSYFTLWGLLRRPTEEILDEVLSELRLLTHREFKTLFPDAQIWTERLCGFRKSYTAFKVPVPAGAVQTFGER